MGALQRQFDLRYPRVMIALACALALSPCVIGQTPPSENAPQSDTPLDQKQAAIRDRVQRLENRMLELSRMLAEREPTKSERLRDGLSLAGKQRVRERVETLITLLKSERFSDAEAVETKLLTDLDALLKLLNSSLNELDRRRQERERLEQKKRAIRRLMEEQTQNLYRTQHLDQQMQREAGDEATAPSRDIADQLGELEQAQRATRRKLNDLQKTPDDPMSPNPDAGRQPLERAAENMRGAADRLGDMSPQQSGEQQKKALENMQEALDDLDDALRQVRREEMEQTLSAIEVRLRRMLTRERDVSVTVAALAEREPQAWTRSDEARLSEAAEIQAQVGEDCRAALRIVVDEGSTVIVPELLRQMAADMEFAGKQLAASDVSAPTRDTLADVVALLEEMLAAIESKQDEMSKAKPQQQQPQNGGQQPQPLLPGSAELKLLRSSQLRLNERTLELRDATARAAAQASAARLSQRQARLSKLARQMNERK